MNGVPKVDNAAEGGRDQYHNGVICDRGADGYISRHVEQAIKIYKKTFANTETTYSYWDHGQDSDDRVEGEMLSEGNVVAKGTENEIYNHYQRDLITEYIGQRR